jgi:hypothetical protein
MDDYRHYHADVGGVQLPRLVRPINERAVTDHLSRDSEVAGCAWTTDRSETRSGIIGSHHSAPFALDIATTAAMPAQEMKAIRQSKE